MASLKIALEGVSTLEKILRNEREIMVWCEQCKARHEFTQAELAALGERVGLQFSFIDRRCRCRLTEGCDGWNKFCFKQAFYFPMSTEEGRQRQMRRDRVEGQATEQGARRPE